MAQEKKDKQETSPTNAEPWEAEKWASKPDRTAWVSPGGEGATGGTSFGVPGPNREAPGGVPRIGLLELGDSLADLEFPASKDEVARGLEGQSMLVGDERIPMSDLVRQLREDRFESPEQVVRGVSGLADYLKRRK